MMQPVPARPGPAPSAVDMPAAELARYAGVYSETAADLWDAIRIEVRNGKLAEILGDTFQTFTHVGNGRFSGDGSPDFFHTITLGGAGKRARLEMSWGGQIRFTGERVDDSALWRPGSAELANYAGTYLSEDIDAAWQLVLRDSRLVVRRRGMTDLALVPISRDLFARSFGSWEDLLNTRIQFHRDRAGTITHFTVSTVPGEGAVNELRFDKYAVR